jgi:hypothetical protein
MPSRLTIEEAEQRHPDLVKGQKWRLSRFNYAYHCVKHGDYLQDFNNHDNRKGCPECGYIKAGDTHRTAEGLSHTPEYVTVDRHFNVILRIKNKKHKSYRGMPFFDGWNPKKGGTFLSGAKWIIDNLGKRPKGCSMHIVDHEKGFVPGNLEWAGPKKQTAQQMFKIIADLKCRIKELERKLEYQEKA